MFPLVGWMHLTFIFFFFYYTSTGCSIIATLNMIVKTVFYFCLSTAKPKTSYRIKGSAYGNEMKIAREPVIVSTFSTVQGSAIF